MIGKQTHSMTKKTMKQNVRQKNNLLYNVQRSKIAFLFVTKTVGLPKANQI